jgi:hypothetical protein
MESMQNKSQNPWHAPLSSMFNTQTMIFLGVGLIIGYQIAKRWGAAAPRPGSAMRLPPAPVMQGLSGMAEPQGRNSGGFENLGDLSQYAPNQAPCTTCDNETSPSQEFEVQ